MKITFLKTYIIIVFICVLCNSCSDNSDVISNSPENLNETSSGSGYFEYTSFKNKTIKVYYHIPSNTNTNSPILFVFHGAGRNANDYRNAMISKSNQYGFIVITPEFSSANFPGGDAYNLGNVYTDGDNPSPSTLNPEDIWTFSLIDPLFDFVKQSLNNISLKYQVFGHSAGGQFAHRFAMYKPNAQYDNIVASGSGWYTVTDFNISFPYGFMESPLELVALTGLFEKKLTIQVGNLDNDPNASGLRHNQYADSQGLNRLDRALHFFNTASQLSVSNNLEFNWELYINQDADHNYEIACEKAADLIFN